MGLISKTAKHSFLTRVLDNWDWLKKEKKPDLDEAVAALDPKPKFGKFKMWLHQKVVFLMVVNLERCMVFLDMGGGKTVLTLMWLKYLKRRGFTPKAIVFVPYVITVDTWLEETEKWTNLKCVPLVGSSQENLLTLTENEDADLFVVAYQSAVAMFSQKKGKGWQLEGPKVTKFIKKHGINFLCMDEVHKCKNPQSLTYRMCRAISKEVRWAIGLTGTPFGRNLEDLWAQFFLIDHGETLGPTLGLYRSVFFKEKINYWGGYEYTFNTKLMGKLKEVIKHRSIRYTIDEMHDMPKRTDMIKEVRANQAIATYYNKMVESLENLSFGTVKYREVESKYMKLRQLSSGFMTLKGDNDSKAEIKFPENPKLDALVDLIESMPAESKMIVFHDFRFTNKIICERLKELKITHASVYGGEKNSLKELRRFKKEPPEKCKVLVINCQAGSSSQNLQMANYVVYFEQPRSAIDRQQSERRAYRPGQEKRVYFYDLIMKGTTDEKQKLNNEEGRDLLKLVLDKQIKFARLS